MAFLQQLFGFDRAESRGSRVHAKLFELFLLQYAVRWAWEWGLFIRKIPAVVAPQGLGRHLDLSFMVGNSLALGNAACLTLAAALVAAGRFRRAMLPIFVLLFHLQYVTRHSLGKVSHGSHYVGIGLLMLALAAWCFPSPAARRRFALGASLFFMGAGYSLAAFSKLGASGVAWVDGRHLWLWIGEKSIDQLSELGVVELNALQRLCLEHHGLATVFSSLGLLTELLGFLLWFARSRVVISLALIGLHLGIFWALGILFDTFIYQLVLLGFPWPQLLDRALDVIRAPRPATSRSS
jgi:hypothetical protein